MPELNIEHRWMCESNRNWRKEVQGNGGVYVVEWGRVYDRDVDYGFTCTCPGYKYRKACRHIRDVSGERCAWHEEYNNPEMAEVDHYTRKCPRCGADVEAVRIGV